MMHHSLVVFVFCCLFWSAMELIGACGAVTVQYYSEYCGAQVHPATHLARREKEFTDNKANECNLWKS